MSRVSLFVATALLGASCTWQGTPVPVVGPTESLEGEWEGTYVSEQTGRTGSILFRLKAGTDSAYGDVVMVPVQTEDVMPPNPSQVLQPSRKMPHLLRISFVRCEPGTVAGTLDPYADPETGERILTTFEGSLRGAEFQGTFTSLYPGSGRRLAGTWSVKRTKQ
jgi:hypothetical protein